MEGGWWSGMVGRVGLVSPSEARGAEWGAGDEWGIRVDQVFVSRKTEELEEREFLSEYRKLHAANFPPLLSGPCSLGEFVAAFPGLVERVAGTGTGRPSLRLAHQRQVGLLAQQILYLFLKFPSITFTRVKFGSAFETAFGRFLDATLVVGSYGGLLEWVEGPGPGRRMELGLREEVAWSLRARYLLLYEEKPMPLPNFARAYKGKYGEELGALVVRLGFPALETLVLRHPHVLLLSPAGVSINPVFLASLGRVKMDIIFPPSAASLVLPPNNAALRRRPPALPLTDAQPTLAPLPHSHSLAHLSAQPQPVLHQWAAKNPVSASLCRLIGIPHPFCPTPSVLPTPDQVGPPPSAPASLPAPTAVSKAPTQPPAQTAESWTGPAGGGAGTGQRDAYRSAQQTLQSSLPTTLPDLSPALTFLS